MDNFPILSPNCGTIDVEEHQVRFNEQILFSEMYLDGVPLPRSHDSRREFYDYVTSIRLEEAICRLEKIEDDRCDWDSGSDPIIVINGAPFVPNERTLEVVCCDDTVPSFQLANRDEFYEFLASHKLRMLLESDVSDLVNWQENLDSTRTPAWLRK